MEFLEVPLFDDDLYKLLVRFSINLIVALAVVFVCYRPVKKDNSFVFTFLLLNVMVFFTCFAMKKLELELGMALGLFAIFGILRYRTDTVPVKEMTYLFVIVGVAVINALSNKKTSYAELATTNLVIIGMAFVLERAFREEVKQRLAKQSMVYDNLKLLDPTKREQLAQDIRERTGLVALEIKVGKIDLQRGTASITVHYENGEATT
ncbi:MAG: DUF4956 domain-containing protein [Planctomycetaceae bacterium]